MFGLRRLAGLDDLLHRLSVLLTNRGLLRSRSFDLMLLRFQREDEHQQRAEYKQNRPHNHILLGLPGEVKINHVKTH